MFAKATTKILEGVPVKKMHHDEFQFEKQGNMFSFSCRHKKRKRMYFICNKADSIGKIEKV